MPRPLPRRQWTLFLAGALLLPLVPLSPAAAQGAPSGGTVNVSVTTPDGSSTRPVNGARVRLIEAGGAEPFGSSSAPGQHQFNAVPAGTYRVQVADPRPYPGYLTKTVTDVVVVDGDTDDVVVSLQQVAGRTDAWDVCQDAQDLGPCVVSVRAVTTDGSAHTGTSDPTVRYGYRPGESWGSFSWGGSDPLGAVVPAGWSFPGLGADGAALVVGARVEPPTDPEFIPLSAHSRHLNLLVQSHPGQRLRADLRFEVTVRTSALVPHVVFGAVADARVTVQASEFTVSGAPMQMIYGPVDPGQEGVIQTREERVWYAEVMAPWRVPCSDQAPTPTLVMTNSLVSAAPDTTGGEIAIKLRGTHLRPEDANGHQALNDTGYYQLVLPQRYVEDQRCSGWGTTLADAAEKGHVRIEEDGRKQRAEETRVVRAVGSEKELVVTVTGFHFSEPVLTLTPQAPPVARVSVGSASVTEPSGSETRDLAFPVVVDNTGVSVPTSVCFTTTPQDGHADGSAAAGSDYTALPVGQTCQVVPANASASLTQRVQIKADGAAEQAETVVLTALDGPDPVAPILARGTGTIADATAASQPVDVPAPSTGEQDAAPSSPPSSPAPTATPSTGASAEPTPGLPAAPPAPVTSSSASPAASPSPAPEVRASLTLLDQSTVAGRPARVLLSGQPGQAVELVGYSRPSTTYRVLRRTVLDRRGEALLSLQPQGSTRLLVRVAGQPQTAGHSQVLPVAPAMTLTAARSGRFVRFAGRVVPTVAGQRVAVHRVTARGSVLTSTATTDAQGRWAVERRFTGAGSHAFDARVLPTADNAAGESPEVRVRVG